MTLRHKTRKMITPMIIRWSRSREVSHLLQFDYHILHSLTPCGAEKLQTTLLVFLDINITETHILWFSAKIYPTCARLRHTRRFFPQNFANHQSFTMFATSNKPDSPGATIHQTYPTAVKGHYGSIVSRSVWPNRSVVLWHIGSPSQIWSLSNL